MIIIIIGLVLLLLASFAKAGGGLPQYNEFLWFFGIIALVAILYAAYKIPDRQ